MTSSGGRKHMGNCEDLKQSPQMDKGYFNLERVLITYSWMIWIWGGGIFLNNECSLEVVWIIRTGAGSFWQPGYTSILKDYGNRKLVSFNYNILNRVHIHMIQNSKNIERFFSEKFSPHTYLLSAWFPNLSHFYLDNHFVPHPNSFRCLQEKANI